MCHHPHFLRRRYRERGRLIVTPFALRARPAHNFALIAVPRTAAPIIQRYSSILLRLL